MSAAPALSGPTALVPGELRGYRRFRLTSAGLCPAVHGSGGPWGSGLELAGCAAGHGHAPPAADCGCGLYGWYHPDDARADSGYGDVPAVIAARGRVVLGDHGFRAAAARVEAVALRRPLGSPRAQHRETLRRVAEQYPDAAVHTSRRRMLHAYPPHDLTALGLAPGPSPAGRGRRRAFALWLVGLVLLYALVPLLARTGAPTTGQALLGLTAFVVWQVALVRLVGSAGDAPAPRRAGPRT